MTFYMRNYERDVETVQGYLRVLEGDLATLQNKALNHKWDELEKDLAEFNQSVLLLLTLVARIRWMILQMVQDATSPSDG